VYLLREEYYRFDVEFSHAVSKGAGIDAQAENSPGIEALKFPAPNGRSVGLGIDG
jgi:hypothetical protein